MKKLNRPINFFTVILFLLFQVACHKGLERTFISNVPLHINQIDLEELEVGSYVGEWNQATPLELETLDLTSCGTVAGQDSLGCIWVNKLACRQRIVVAKAVNDTIIKTPSLKSLHAKTVRIKVLDNKSHNPVIKEFKNVTIKDPYISQLVLSQKPGGGNQSLELNQTLTAAERAQKKVKDAKRLRAEKAKDSPLHAASMLEPNLDNLDSAVAAIILYLKQYKPNGGSIDLDAFRLQIDDINQETANLVNGMTNPASEVIELKVYFPSASYEIDEARNGSVLNDYLNGIISDYSSTKPIGSSPLSVKVKIAAYADLQNITDLSLQRDLCIKYSTSCDGSQECLNKLLSRARAEAVRDWFEKAITQKIGPGSVVNVTITANGEGWGVPKTYQGSCPNKNCEDRRIALISRVVF